MMLTYIFDYDAPNVVAYKHDRPVLISKSQFWRL